MKKVLLAGVAALLMATSAAHAQQPDFKTLSSFKLECESMYQDRRHVWFEIIPSENIVKMTNQEVETFSFSITKTITSITSTKNEFGHYITVPYVAWIWFQDGGGKTREVRQWSSALDPYSRVSYFYGPSYGNTEKWGYTCIFVS
jgi:hypothetical protein